MGDSINSNSGSDSEINLRGRGKRRHALLSSSESSESSFGHSSSSARKRSRGHQDSGSEISARPSNFAGDRESDSSESSDDVRTTRRSLRKFRSAFLSSDTDGSSSDSDIVRPSMRWRNVRTTLAVASDTETDGSSSEGDIVRPVLRGRSITTAVVQASSDSSESGGEGDPAKASRISASVFPQPANSSNELSDSGDELTEKCAICLRRISSQEVGSPEGCDHLFCLTCLVEWAKKSNRCPLDRQPFTLILVRDDKEGKLVRRLPVEQPEPLSELEDFIHCWVCGTSDREEVMLLCDGCDRGFHLDCLNPPLPAVPEEDEWFCPNCAENTQVENAPDTSFGNDEEEIEPEDEGNREAGTQTTPRTGRQSRPRPSRTRVGRTRQSSRIWTAVHQSILRVLDHAAEALWVQPSTSGMNESQPSPSSSRRRTESRPKQRTASTAKPRKKPVKRRKRKTTRRRVIHKKIVVLEDGSVTEEILEFRKKAFKKRRKKTRKRTLKKKRGPTISRRSAREPRSAPRTVRGRLAQTLGMVAAANPRQLLPEVTPTRRRETVAQGVDVSRAKAGIPRLHIFGPRNELAPVSSGSDDEDIGEGEGGVGLLARRRVGISSRRLERSKAVELFRTSTRPRPSRPLPQPTNTGTADLLGSILECQTIWHSKNSNVMIRADGTVELPTPKKPDVRHAAVERVTTQAPIHSTSGSQPPGFRPYSNNPASGPSSDQQGHASASGGNLQRFGAPRNDRERYTNFFNSIGPPGPAPFQRGGPPLRFRMPPRPQLRRIPLRPVRQLWPQEDEGEEGDGEDIGEGNNELDPEMGESSQRVEEGEIDEEEDESKSKTNDDEVDLYSDIETNNTEKEDDGGDRSGDGEKIYPALAAPPEPPAFLLGMGLDEEQRNEPEVYDPAEPCDSDEEMVIDEGQERKRAAPATPPTPPTPPPMPSTPPRDDDDEECPIFSVYSSASVEFSRKNEEERARVFAGYTSPRSAENEGTEPKVDEEDELQDEASKSVKESPTKGTTPVIGARLSFNIDGSPHEEESQESSLPSEHIKSPREDVLSPEQKEKEIVPASDDKSGEDEITSPIEDTAEPKSPISSPSGSESPQYPVDECSPRVRSISGTEVPEGDSDIGKQDDQLPESEIPRVTTGLEGLDVEEVSSEMEENDFNDDCSISSLSLSGLSNRSKQTSSFASRKKKKKKKRQRLKSKSDKCASEEGEIDSDKDKRKSDNNENKTSDENKGDTDKKKRRRSKSRSSERQVLGSKENKKSKDDLSWKKPSKKDKNYREGRKFSKERDRGKDRRSTSPKKDKKKGKERKKSDKEKKKEIERYDVRKVVKNKEVRRVDAFGRDLPSRSVSLSHSRSKSRSRSRGRARNLRKGSRSPSKSPRGFRRGRSPIRRRFRSRSRSSPSPKRNKKKIRSDDKKGRSRSRGPRRSWSRRRSASRSPRGGRVGKKFPRSKKSWSRSISLSPPPRSPSPVRIRRSLSHLRTRRSLSQSWSRPRSPLPPPREPSLEKLTVVLTSKDRKKKKKRKEEKRPKRSDSKRRKTGISKEVFASGDNVLVSVNFNRTNKSGNTPPLASISPVREVTKKKKRTADQSDKTSKKTKSTSAVSKTVVDAALASQAGPSKRKKLTRLNEKEAEVILSRKPVAVIDLDMSPYREQTPSPVNVVVVSDSGSGDEGKAPTPQRTASPEVAHLASAPSAPAVPIPTPASYLLSSSGPKTPPEPPVKFSISKPLQLRPIANPLADDGDEEGEAEGDLRNEDDTEGNLEVMHKGPNTPPEPRGPSTPSPQTSPDAYDPFEPTKSRSPSPMPDAGEAAAEKVDAPSTEALPVGTVLAGDVENFPPSDSIEATRDDSAKEGGDISETPAGIDSIGPQSESLEPTKPPLPLLKKPTTQPMAPISLPTLPIFSLPSPNKTANRQQGIASLQVSGIQRLQHRLGSPVNKTPNSIKTTPEKRGTELFSTGNYQIRNAGKRNGEGKPRPLQDATNETVDMDDSPYSPASSEGDDLFDPPAEASKPVKPPTVIPFKAAKATPVKPGNKFDILFGSSPLKNGSKKPPKPIKGAAKTGTKGSKKGKKGISMKMDEDQLRILDELPSSAVELQVKDKFLKKLNRQERVVDEVKTVLKPHYARKHITKEEYKDILRKAVPKICHSKSGEINPSKIQNLVEAYVRKFRHAKKKAAGGPVKPKLKKTNLFS